MKILYVTTVSNTMNAFLIPHIRMLYQKGYHIDLACNIQQPISSELVNYVQNIYNVSFERAPISKKNIDASIELNKIIKQNSYDIVHTHTPIASMITRLVCKNKPSTKVFYTAHGFHFFKGAPLLNWLVYYPIEKYLSRYTDTLITINKEDYHRAKSKFKTNYIAYIPGVGLDLSRTNTQISSRVDKLREIGIDSDSFIVLSVGELNKNKNHETVIRAINEIGLSKVHYIICGEGKRKGYLENLSKELNISNNVHILGYRKDVFNWYSSSDIFVFPSYREGLGMAALEAMSFGLPIITSDVHGIVDYSQNGKTGYNFKPSDFKGIAKAIEKLYVEENNRMSIGMYNKRVVEKYDVNHCILILDEIYKKSMTNKFK